MKTALILLTIIMVLSAPDIIAEDIDTFWVRTYNEPISTADIGHALNVKNAGDIYMTSEYAYKADGEDIKTFVIITAIAADSSIKSIKSAENIELFPAPMTIVAYSIMKEKSIVPDDDKNWINLKIVDPAGNSIGKTADGDDFQTIFPATYVEHPQSDSVTIHSPLAGDYIVIVISESDAPSDVAYGIGIRIDGSLQSMLVDNIDIPQASEADTLGN